MDKKEDVYDVLIMRDREAGLFSRRHLAVIEDEDGNLVDFRYAWTQRGARRRGMKALTRILEEVE